MARSSTTFSAKWKTGPTAVVRVPTKLAAQILDYAHELDAREAAGGFQEPTAAYRTAEDVVLTKPVNVASVPQRSPFRYPGGKTWLVPYIRSWLSRHARRQLNIMPVRPAQFIEPFAGGGIASLTVAAEDLADLVTMVEIDENVAAVW